MTCKLDDDGEALQIVLVSLASRVAGPDAQALSVKHG